MDRFALLSISGPRTSSSTLTVFPGLTSPRATSLPDIAKPASPTEAPRPAQAPPPPHTTSTLRHGVVLSPDCVPGDPQDAARPRQSCTIYRPWFSPYSYFVCLEKDSRPEARGLPELSRDEGWGDGRLPEDAADSACSSSSSLDPPACLREATIKPRSGPDAADHVTSQDLLRASRWLPAQQGGFQCVACCRMYPTLGSLRSHVTYGFREGFSCRVFYRKLKALWARPADRLAPSSVGCQPRK